MDDRDLIDYQFKKIYGRYPSVSERLQFKKNRPRTLFITDADLARMREVVDIPNWKRQSENYKRAKGLLVEEPGDKETNETTT